MYLLRIGALFHFSRKLPDAFRGQNPNLASGPRKIGGNGYLRFSLGTGNHRKSGRLAPGACIFSVTWSPQSRFGGMLLWPNATSSRKSANVLETGKRSLVKCRPGMRREEFVSCNAVRPVVWRR